MLLLLLLLGSGGLLGPSSARVLVLDPDWFLLLLVVRDERLVASLGGVTDRPLSGRREGPRLGGGGGGRSERTGGS